MSDFGNDRKHLNVDNLFLNYAKFFKSHPRVMLYNWILLHLPRLSHKHGENADGLGGAWMCAMQMVSGVSPCPWTKKKNYRQQASVS